MASVQELIAASQHNAKASSPFAQIMESALSGAVTGFDQAPDRMKSMLELQMAEEQRQRQAEMDQQIKQQLAQRNEARIAQAKTAAKGGVTPTMPGAKFKEVISQNEKGQYSRKFEEVDGASNLVYTPAQAAAVASGDVRRVLAEFPGGVPREVMQQLFSAERIAALEAERKVRGDERRVERLKKTFAAIDVTDPVVKRLRDQEMNLSMVPDLMQLAKEGNTVSMAATGTRMARGMGEVGVLTDQDVIRYIESGMITRKVFDKWKMLTSGVPTKMTQDEISQVTNTITRSLADKIADRKNDLLESHAGIEGVTPEELAANLVLPYAKSQRRINGEKGASGVQNPARGARRVGNASYSTR